jgi:hypothetical protein
VRYYQSTYQSFEEYLAKGSGDWLLESFDWVQRCCELGFALSQNIATNVSRCGIRELGVVGELNLRQGRGENQHLKVT